jgi:Uncharacterized protein family UPF0004
MDNNISVVENLGSCKQKTNSILRKESKYSSPSMSSVGTKIVKTEKFVVPSTRTTSIVPLSSSSSLQKQQQRSMKFYLKTYGCQMNVNDSDIVRSILIESGYNKVDDEMMATIVLMNTCSIPTYSYKLLPQH